MEQLLLEKMPHVSYYEQLCRFLSNSSEKRRIGAIHPELIKDGNENIIGQFVESIIQIVFLHVA